MIDYLLRYWSEIFAVVTGLIYIFLEVKQNKNMWIVGIITSSVMMYVFFSAKIYAYAAMYAYYVIISVYGYFRWYWQEKIVKKTLATDLTVGARHASPLQYTLICLIISIILSLAIGYVLATFTDSPVPYFDGLTSGFSIVATWMLTQKIIQHWYFWIGINLFSVPLCLSQSLYWSAFLFVVYVVMSIIGLREWRRHA